MRKLFPYLILNFIVSAAAVLLVLVIWEAAHKNTDAQRTVINPTMTAVAESSSTLPPANEKTLEIQVVVGAGDISNEHIELVSVAKGPVNLQGWEITDGKDTRYVFPAVTIYPGGGINLYSGAGSNSSIELYWNQAAALWASGDTIFLKDSEGNTRAKYRIP